jgi:hypothetical protein
LSVVTSSLALRIRRAERAIPESDFPKLTSEAAAIRYAIENSGLQDKSVAIEIETDPAVLSKAKCGQARLNDDALSALMDVTGIEAPLVAMLLRRGYDPRSLRKLETETERELRETREELERMRAERAVEMKLMRELRS